MENLYILRNDLCGKSKHLKSLKFDTKMNDKNRKIITEEQEKCYVKFKLLDTILREKSKK